VWEYRPLGVDMQTKEKCWVFTLTHLPTGNFFVGITAHPNVQQATFKKLLESGKYNDIRFQKLFKSWSEMEYGLDQYPDEEQANVEMQNTLLSCKGNPKCLNNPVFPAGGYIMADHPHFNQYMNRFEGISCVYVLKNKRTGHFYIGSTKSVSTRTKTHLRELKEGVHHCYKLQKDYRGLSGIEFGVFPAGEVADARKLEQKMLDMFHGKDGCLNSSNSAYSNYNEVPEEWKHRYYKGSMRDPNVKKRPKPASRPSQPSSVTKPSYAFKQPLFAKSRSALL
jgi:hypothetical protein